MMSELLCHLFGDYVLQNDWMANNKKQNTGVAVVHAFVYTLLFMFVLYGQGLCSQAAILVIFGTHAVIDRFALAGYWVRFYGVGQTAPDYLKVWLLIIVDNTFHLTINHLAILYL